MVFHKDNHKQVRWQDVATAATDAGRILDTNVPRGCGALRLLCGFSCWAKFSVHVVIAMNALFE